MRRCAPAAIVSAALLLTLPVCSAGTPPSTFCGDGERIVFACSSGAKRVALCERPASGERAASLQYRIGRPGAPPEMVYPGQGEASPAFLSGTATLSGGGGAWVEFTRPPYRSVVFSFWLQGSGETAGVAVESAGKRRATLRCRAGARSELGPDYFSAAQLPTSEQDFLP